MEDNFFPQTRAGGGWFGDDSSALCLLCSIFLLLLHQLHLGSSGIRLQRLGTPSLKHTFTILTVPMDQEPEFSPVGPLLRVLPAYNLHSFLELQVFLKAHLIVGRIQFLVVRGLRFLLSC